MFSGTGSGIGYSVTVPADTTERVLTLLAGGYGANMRVTAHLSDSSVADKVDDSSVWADIALNQVITVKYAAASAGQTLVVTFTQYNSSNAYSNTNIQSAALRIAVPVSFSGPVPNRTGMVGGAASFANASFFSGNATPFTYTLQAGTLPAGLTLNSATGAISGTPTTVGTQAGIIVRATDADGVTASTNAFSINIVAAKSPPTFTGNIATVNGSAGNAITPVNVSTAFSDTNTLTYSASPAGTTWPAGLVINASTGIISGTVAAMSTTAGLRVRATDVAGQTVDSNAFNVVIAAAPGTFTTDAWISAGTLRAGQAFSGTWYSGGAPGTAGGTATLKSGTLSDGGVATLTGLPAGAGFFLGATSDGGRYYQEGTVT